MAQLYGVWIDSIRALTATPDDAATHLDRRLRLTTAVGRALSHTDPALDRLVYGVWLERHLEPVYIGQTLEGRRRLWDLPIGESHHLANSFPPEIWSRVVVVYWDVLLQQSPTLTERITAMLLSHGISDTSDAAIGLGLEFLLQRQFQPLFNRRKKRRDGSWRVVDWESSESRGALAAQHLGEFFPQVAHVWGTLAALPSGPDGVASLPGGRVVFPGAVLRSSL